MSIEGGTAIVLTYLLVSIGVIVAFVGPCSWSDRSSDGSASAADGAEKSNYPRFINREPRNIAAGTCEARDEAAGIGYVHDHDGYGLRLADKSASHGRGHTEDCVGS
jgi:hypothetical protein